MADHHTERDCRKEYINSLVQSYIPDISTLEDSTQTVIQTIFEWSLSNFEKRLKLYCSSAPRGDEEELRRYMQTSDIQENYLMQIFRSRQIKDMRLPVLVLYSIKLCIHRTSRPLSFNHAEGARNRVALAIPDVVIPTGPLTASMLATEQEQKQMLGERLFPLIQRMHPDLAGKITGMLLEIDNSELLHMLESNEYLRVKVDEAVAVLEAHQAKEMAGKRLW